MCLMLQNNRNCRWKIFLNGIKNFSGLKFENILNYVPIFFFSFFLVIMQMNGFLISLLYFDCRKCIEG